MMAILTRPALEIPAVRLRGANELRDDDDDLLSVELGAELRVELSEEREVALDECFMTRSGFDALFGNSHSSGRRSNVIVF